MTEIRVTWRHAAPLLRAGRVATQLIVLMSSFASGANAQTFTPTQAVNQTACSTYFWQTSCSTIQTNRVTKGFLRAQTGRDLFEVLAGTATHCISVDHPSQKCERGVTVAADPNWNRVIWGQAGQFLLAYGSVGNGAGQFFRPQGVAITRLEGEWHVAFVADSWNNRVAVLALGYNCRCVRWLGTLTGAESGTPLANPTAVAWDAVQTWTMADDRVFITDQRNNRIVIYQVGLDPVAGTMTKQYVGSLGGFGTNPDQLAGPTGVAVNSYSTDGSGYVYVSDAGNSRIVRWTIVTASPSSPPSFPYPPKVATLPVGARPGGITFDHYGDVIVADAGRNRLRRFSNDLTFLKEYGGGTQWANGNFAAPLDAQVVSSYYQAFLPGTTTLMFVREGLPYVNVTESWGDTTGLQLQRLGVDADSLKVVSVDNTLRQATFTFLFTGTGQHKVQIARSSSPTSVVRTVQSEFTHSGWQSAVWDGKDNAGATMSYGQYVAFVEHESGYQYDDGLARTSAPVSFWLDDPAPMTASISGPTAIAPGASYTWTADANHGRSPYSYVWSITSDDGVDNGTIVGTNYSYTTSRSSCSTFTLRADVNSSNAKTATAQTRVTVDPSLGGSGRCLLMGSLASVDDAPAEYQMSQNVAESQVPADGALGVNRISGGGVRANLVPGDRGSQIANLRANGVTSIRFGIPRPPSGAAMAARASKSGQFLSANGARAADGADVPVRIQIFDLHGQVVRHGVDGKLSPGYYRYAWDGRNDGGQSVSPGVYVIELTATGYAHRTKLILTR